MKKLFLILSLFGFANSIYSDPYAQCDANYKTCKSDKSKAAATCDRDYADCKGATASTLVTGIPSGLASWFTS